LTKDQKKELAISLREKDWTQERISKSLGTPRRTIADWLKFGETAIIDQHSLSLNQDELLTLKIRAEEAEKRAEIIKNEVDEKVRVRLDAMSAEFQKRYDEAVAKANAANKPASIDQAAIDKLVDERAAGKMEALEKARREAEAERVSFDKAHKAKMEQLDRVYETKEKQLQLQIDSKLKEIGEAQKMRLDVTALEKEKMRLASDLGHLQAKREMEEEDAKIREKLRKSLQVLTPLSNITFMFKEKLSVSVDNCGLSIEEMMDISKEMEYLIEKISESVDCLRAQIEKAKQGGALHVV
jgi:hypothetical protein